VNVSSERVKERLPALMHELFTFSSKVIEMFIVQGDPKRFVPIFYLIKKSIF
jgi:hypothetical protein